MKLSARGFEKISRRVQKIESAHRRISPKAEASGLNKAAAAARKAARKEAVARSGLPASAINKRFYMQRADSRKPRRWAYVRGYTMHKAGAAEFSASYRKDGKLVAKQIKSGVKVGSKLVRGAFIGKSKHRGREFVGKRTSKDRDSMVFPGFRVKSIIGNAVKHQERRAAKIVEREALAYYRRSMDKAVARMRG